MAKMVSKVDENALTSISSGELIPSNIISPLSHSSKREMQKIKKQKEMEEDSHDHEHSEELDVAKAFCTHG